MDILVFSNSKNIKTFFTWIDKSKQFTIQFMPCAELKKALKGAPDGTFIYYDITNQTEPEIKKTVKWLSSLKSYQYGIIDPKGSYRDIAALFHNGASDYISKLLLKDQFTEKRLQAVITFGTKTLSRGAKKEKKEEYTKPKHILSGNDWKNIKTGNEYTFTILFAELDNMGTLKKIVGPDHLNTAIERFQDYLSSVTEQINGKTWIKMDSGLVVLFPFNGKKCSAVLTCFRMMLDRNIISAEDIGFNTLISYRIALHIGNTVYRKRGDTGGIISDTINSIFHLGQKYAEPGNLYITQDVFPFIPPGLNEYFVPAGIYEGRRIMRMRTIQ